MRDLLAGLLLGALGTAIAAGYLYLRAKRGVRRELTRQERIRRRRLGALAVVGAVLLLVLLLLVAGSSGDEDRELGETHGATIAHVTIDSEAVGEALETAVVIPPDANPPDAGRSLLVFLHEQGGDSETYLDDEAMFEALSRLGGVAPMIAFPDGEDSYWHDRDDGSWAEYVTQEVIPTVSRTFGTDPERVAIGGISMGGFGALDIARLHPQRFCAAGAHSPALWEDADEAGEGSFDDDQDFETHDLIEIAEESPAPFLQFSVWIDIGDEDEFRAATEALIDALGVAKAPVNGQVLEGGHDREYWDQHWDEYLRFYGTELEACGGPPPVVVG